MKSSWSHHKYLCCYKCHECMPQLWFPMTLWSGTSFPSTLHRVILCVWRLPSNLLAEDQLPCVCSCYFMDSHVGVCLRTRDWMKLWLNEGLCWAVSSLYQQCIHVAYWRTKGHEKVWVHMVLFTQKMWHTLYSASLKLLTNKDRWKMHLFGFHFSLANLSKIIICLSDFICSQTF